MLDDGAVDGEFVLVGVGGGVAVSLGAAAAAFGRFGNQRLQDLLDDAVVPGGGGVVLVGGRGGEGAGAGVGGNLAEARGGDGLRGRGCD